MHTIGEVAKLANVSVRTLHHYDDIGLLSPSARSETGYRLYDSVDLERLARILTYRELDFELATIRELLDDPGSDEATHLRRQAELLDRRAARLDAVRATLRKTLEARRMGIDLDPKEMLEVFGDVDPTRHAAEAEERWGDTDAYAQSRERARNYRKEDWKEMQAQMDAVHGRLAEALRAGTPATDPAAMDAAEAHRRLITRLFYDLSHEMHGNLADMYVADPRFTATYEAIEPGLASYVAEAIHANAKREGGAIVPHEHDTSD